MRLTVCSLLASALAAASALPPAIISAQETRRHFLWSVNTPGAPTTYLLGSLHVLTPRHYPLAPRIEQAFAESTVLIEELDLDELGNPAALAGLMGKAMLSGGRTLDQVIDKDLYAALAKRATAAGVPLAAIQRLKPWMAAIALAAPALAAAGYKGELGVDRHFFDRAKKSGIERRGLETLAYQFDRLDQLSSADQEAMLRSSIEELDATLASVDAMADAWSRGDVAMLEKELHTISTQSPGVHTRLLVERNRAWVPQVVRCLTSKTACFVVVGAAHLVGPDSLVDLLRKQGYEVVQQ